MIKINTDTNKLLESWSWLYVLPGIKGISIPDFRVKVLVPIYMIYKNLINNFECIICSSRICKACPYFLKYYLMFRQVARKLVQTTKSFCNSFQY